MLIIEIISELEKMQARSDRMRSRGNTIVFVPTMGFLHEGHLSLVREGFNHGNDLIVSIFVNPTQFGPGEDLDSYPRSIERDIELLQKENVNAVFIPDSEKIYGEDFQTFVRLEKLPDYLCGISRPTHFTGVTTVVTKLFNIIKPHVAIFGRKDYQQFIIIRQLVKDLNYDIKIIGASIVREPDGLAMSSRNSYLTRKQRKYALSLYRSLKTAESMVKDGVSDTAGIVDAATRIITSNPETKIDYIKICDPDTLKDVDNIDRPVLMALAVRVGKTRLIDNMILGN